MRHAMSLAQPGGACYLPVLGRFDDDIGRYALTFMAAAKPGLGAALPVIEL